MMKYSKKPSYLGYAVLNAEGQKVAKVKTFELAAMAALGHLLDRSTQGETAVYFRERRHDRHGSPKRARVYRIEITEEETLDSGDLDVEG